MVAMGQQTVGTLGSAVAQTPLDLTTASIGKQLMLLGMPVVLAVAPLFATVMAVGLASNFGQVGFVLSGEAMSPNLEKINPMAGLKRMFSRRATVEGLKATAKMLLFGYIAYAVIAQNWNQLVNLSSLHPVQAATQIGLVCHTILVRIALVWLVIAALDYWFQRMEVDKQLKMTKAELKREMKEQEGSPEIKSAQFQKRRQLLKGGLATKLKSADVLVTNPTHFAVAIKYERNKMHAPMVVAKGQDFLALKMREIAAAHKLPIVENKPLARQLYKRCEAGDYVPRDLFTPVAEVLAYVYKTIKRVRNQSRTAA